MKNILFAFWGLLSLNGKAVAEAIQSAGQKETPPSPTIKPLKVSELYPNLFSTVYDFFHDIQVAFFEGFVSLKDFVETGEWFITELKNPEMRDLVGSFGIQLGVSLVFAFAIAHFVAVWLRPKIQKLLHKDSLVSEPYNKFMQAAALPTTASSLSEFLISQRNKKLAQATLLSVLPPLLFGFLLYTLFRTIVPYDQVYLETVRILSSGSVTIWILLNVAHIFLRPVTPEHQHIPLPQEALNSLYVWIRRIGFVALLGFFALETGRLIHLPEAGERLLLQGSSFVIAIMASFMVLSLHKTLKNWIQIQREQPQRSRLKMALLPYLEYSYIPLIVFIVISYISWVTPGYDRFQVIVWKFLVTLVLLPCLQYGTYCLKKVRILYIHRNLKRLSPTFSRRSLFYGRQIDFALIVLLYLIAVMLILDLWGFDPYYLISSNTGRWVTEKIFSIFIIVIVALFTTRAGMGLLNKYLIAEQDTQNEKYSQKIARFKTIHTISRNILHIAIWAPAFLLIVVEMDIDIIPILAPLTVLAVGVGLGVQSHVKDFVTGFFMLLEDAFAVGDLVVINGQMGRIESLSVRVVRLRATDGSLYTFPYGNITNLCNQNRDFSAAVLLFQVGIETDMNQLYEILEKISKDLKKDPKIHNLIIDSIQIDGINEISDHALQIRAILKTKPSMHYKVKWAFNILLKQYIELYHIPSATPRQLSYNYTIEK